MKIEYLKEFVVLAQYLNFSTAAVKLYMTQPVLSRHISMLESQLGVQLLKRNSQGVSLTPVGSLFLERIKDILSDYDELANEVLLKEQKFNDVLRIGLNYYSMNYYLGKIPQVFIKEYPQIKLAYLTGNPDQSVEALLHDQVDVILIGHHPFRSADRLQFHDLFQEPFCVLLPGSHPLAGRPSVSVTDLSGETFLGVETMFFASTWAYIRSLCQKNGFEPNGPLLYNQLESVTLAVEQGAGVMVEGQILHHLTSDTLTCLPLVGEGCHRVVSIAYKAENPNPVIPLFLDVADRVRARAAEASHPPHRGHATTRTKPHA